ncbi:hypothetical protein OA07_20665 [Aphanizomenon flos-aquae 2012/KM1/D3]|uniref:hypothetical protein n=1 Tax=Aphanizomenon flos-aquae TaxID=1176 RepID=UPI00054292F8|nr:hypothetical protein [Aphanizomenon flos-aquae]KHG39921.1 hypothetical protein OA07_20665 [Aphanizomenon flos-aquae 2012/KM1/D3]
MFRRVLCSLSLAASIVIVSSASSYGQISQYRRAKEAVENIPEVKKAAQNTWERSGQFIESVGKGIESAGKGIGNFLAGTGLYCFGTQLASPCPRSDSPHYLTNSQPKRVFENETHNLRKANPLLQGNGVFPNLSPGRGEAWRFENETHNLQKLTPSYKGMGLLKPLP